MTGSRWGGRRQDGIEKPQYRLMALPRTPNPVPYVIASGSIAYLWRLAVQLDAVKGGRGKRGGAHGRRWIEMNFEPATVKRLRQITVFE